MKKTNRYPAIKTMPAALILWLFSCTPVSKTKNINSNRPQASQNAVPAAMAEGKHAYALQTFQVQDESGKFRGWGYDVYVDLQKKIHQPIIPGVPGNNSFKTESDARLIGNFVINKMDENGGLPTISTNELDSLGITR